MSVSRSGMHYLSGIYNQWHAFTSPPQHTRASLLCVRAGPSNVELAIADAQTAQYRSPKSHVLKLGEHVTLHQTVRVVQWVKCIRHRLAAQLLLGTLLPLGMATAWAALGIRRGECARVIRSHTLFCTGGQYAGSYVVTFEYLLSYQPL